MALIEKEVQPTKIILVCDKCSKSVEMRFTGLVLQSCPAQYQHECLECGNTKSVDRVYPTIEYRETNKQ